MTLWGFCVVAALSSQMRGLPLTRSWRMGKSRRMEAASKESAGRLSEERSLELAVKGEEAMGSIDGIETSWRISFRNPKPRERSAGFAAAGAPGICGAVRGICESLTRGGGVVENSSAIERKSVSVGILMASRDGDGAEVMPAKPKSGRASSRNAKALVGSEKRARSGLPGMAGGDIRAPGIAGTCGWTF